MGFLSSVGSILGGSSKSKSAPASVYGAQDPFLQDLYARSQLASYGNMGQNYANQINQGAQTGFENQMGGGNMYDQGGLNSIASGQMQNQNLNGAIDAGLGQINRNFNRNIMPGINTGSAMTNTSGGSRQGIAQGLAMSDANQQATDFVNQMQSQNYQQGIQNQLGAYGQMSQNNAIQNQATQSAMNAAPQLANLGFGAQYGDMSALASLIGSPTVLGGGSSGSSQGGIGSSLSGASSMLGVLSDVRAKENIKRVGSTDGGLPVYTYNYKGQNAVHMGVMAQEAEIANPASVTEINGLKHVNYSMVR